MFVFLCWCLGIWAWDDWDDSWCWHLVLSLVLLVGIVSCFLLLSCDLRKVVGCCLEDASAGWWVAERRGSCKRAVVGLRVRIEYSWRTGRTVWITNMAQEVPARKCFQVLGADKEMDMGEEEGLREPTGRRKACSTPRFDRVPREWRWGGRRGTWRRLLWGWRETGGTVTEDRKEWQVPLEVPCGKCF